MCPQFCDVTLTLRLTMPVMQGFNRIDVPGDQLVAKVETVGCRASMRERSMAAAGDLALVRRMSKAIQKVLDLLITNLTSKSKAYKTKVRPGQPPCPTAPEYAHFILRQEGAEHPAYVAFSMRYSGTHVKSINAAAAKWISIMFSMYVPQLVYMPMHAPHSGLFNFHPSTQLNEWCARAAAGGGVHDEQPALHGEDGGELRGAHGAGGGVDRAAQGPGVLLSSESQKHLLALKVPEV